MAKDLTLKTPDGSTILYPKTVQNLVFNNVTGRPLSEDSKDICFDISEYKRGATYANLASALGTNGANVPEGIRKGGMSIKFIQSSDNKYVQYRLMVDTFSTTVTDWQGVDVEPIEGSRNLVESGGVAYQLGYKKVIHPNFTWGAYIDTSGNIVSGYDNWGISDVILLKAGNTIFVSTMGSNVTVIAATDEEKTFYTPLIIAPRGIIPYSTYQYTATQDMYIVICNRNDGNPINEISIGEVVRKPLYDLDLEVINDSLKKNKLDLFFFQGEWVVNTTSNSVTIRGNEANNVGFYRLPETSVTKYIRLLEETSYIIGNEECLVVDISDNTLKKISTYTPNKNYIPLYGVYKKERWGLLYEYVMLNKIDPLVNDIYIIEQKTLSIEQKTLLYGKTLSYIDTINFPYETGQIYGNEGSVITNSGADYWHHIKIEKSQNSVQFVEFKRRSNPNVSYYVIYTDSNDIIKAREYQGVSEEDEISFVPYYPNNSTRVYISSANINPIKVYVLDDSYNVNKQIESITNWDNICRSVCRIADGLSAPRQTPAGYKIAYDLGLRIMLCDLRFTSDNVPVLEHDDYINQYYNNVYDINGQLVSTAEGSRVYIDQTTYADLQQYDYGLYKGESYRGTKIMSLEQMCQFAKKYGTEIYLEMKTSLTSEQVNIVISMIKGYGLWGKTTWCPQSPNAMDVVVAIEPKVYINQHSNIGSGSLTIGAIEKLHSYQNNYNEGKVTITCSLEGTIPQDVANKMFEYNIGLMATTLNTQQQILDYYNRGGYYRMFTEVLTNNLNCGKILFNNLQ